MRTTRGLIRAMAATVGVVVSLSYMSASAFAQSCATVPTSPTGWWPGEGSGLDIVDGRNATLHNGATYGSGQVGQAFQFDGVDDDATIANAAALNVGSGDFTMEFWVKNNDGSGERVMVEKWDSDANTGWTLANRGGLYFAGPGGDISTGAEIPVGAWTHIALRRNGGGIGLFLNGGQVGSGTNTNDLTTSVPLLFGRRRGSQGFFWNGLIDEVHLFVGTALSNAEIQAIYDAGSDGLCNPCGDGVLDAGEDCDDNNTTDGDGCDSNCTITACGNGISTGSEECDDGNLVNGDSCDNNCTTPRCGNHEVGPTEGCDDGNLLDGDGCDSNCTVTGCPNGIVTAGENCDDGNYENGDTCDNNCTAPSCGNGEQSPLEECDDGNLVDGDGCDSNCTATACGNGIATGAEECDDGNVTSGDSCDSNCTTPRCGNDEIGAGETCDDGNIRDGDGCDSNCQPSTCGNGAVARGHSCDATATSGASCVELCDGAWETLLGTGMGEITMVAASGYDLYVAGAVDGISGVVKWDGAVATVLGGGVDGEIWAMAAKGEDLYAGGAFALIADQPVGNIAKWNGSSWSSLRSGTDAEVSALQFLGNDLYVAGDFSTAGGISANKIAKWDGGSWSALGSGMDGTVKALAVLNGELYAGGSFSTAGGVAANHVAKWNGSSWSALGAGTPDEVGVLAVVGTTVYAAGPWFLLKWDGASWSTLTAGTYEVVTMAGSSDNLFASGFFNNDPTLSVPAKRIARWDGAAWHALGTGIDRVAEGMAWNGRQLLVSGGFSLAGGKPVENGLASWTSNACGEQCDDSNTIDGDGCDADCTPSICGNGRVVGAEECDDGNRSNGDGCDNNCTVTGCGNGIAAEGEMCDDGNATDGDGCESDCTITSVSEVLTGTGTVSTDTGSGATPEVPVQTSITTTGAGTVSIAPPSGPGTPEGLSVIGTQLQIEAPPASIDDPLVIVLSIEGTALPEGVSYDQLDVTRDGVVILDCSGPAGKAIPDPCVQSRVLLMNGDAQITLLSVHASLWSAVVRGLSKSELKCVNGVGKSAFKVAAAQGSLNGKCLKAAAKGDEGDPQGCVSSHSNAKVRGAIAKAVDFETGACVPQPPFGLTNAPVASGAGRQAMLQLIADVLGADLNASATANPAGAECQAAALKTTTKLLEKEAKALLACKKAGLVGKTQLIVSTADISRCLDELAADVDGKIAKAVIKLVDTLADKCNGVDLSSTLAGWCANAGDVGQCLANRVACRACRMFNTAESLSVDCDALDNEATDGSCN